MCTKLKHCGRRHIAFGQALREWGKDVGGLCISKVSILEECGYTGSYLNYPSPAQCSAHEKQFISTFERGI